jgi:hypothetical protein
METDPKPYVRPLCQSCGTGLRLPGKPLCHQCQEAKIQAQYAELDARVLHEMAWRPNPPPTAPPAVPEPPTWICPYCGPAGYVSVDTAVFQCRSCGWDPNNPTANLRPRDIPPAL